MVVYSYDMDDASRIVMKILHVSNGWERWNCAAVIARHVMDEQRRAGHEVVSRRWAGIRELRSADEVWIHCGWTPCLWWANLWAKGAVRVPEACYDPVRLAYHGWKKRLVGPVERWALRRCARIVATCDEERRWIEAYVGKGCPPVEVTDIKRFFRFGSAGRTARKDSPLHVLYLGRRHPLKGTRYLEEAVAGLGGVELRLVSNAHGEEKERVWDWCDVLCLPTLSDNFGLVVAEALERGKFVVTTDGAPAWKDIPPERGVYLTGYRDGSDALRVQLLRDALSGLLP